MIPLLLALWLEPAQADDMPAAMLQVAEALEKGNAGDRRGAIKLLSKVLEAAPDNVDAKVGRGVNRYLIGDLVAAREDLSHAFSDQVWEDKVITQESLTEITATTSTLDLVEQRQTGAAILVVLAARDGKIDEGRETVALSRATFGPHAQIDAAEARLILAQGETAQAWSKLRGALGQPDPTLFVQSIASEMVASDPQSAPLAVTDWLKAAGQWTAHYNAAIGHFRDKRYGPCVDEVALGLVAFPSNPKMLAVGYPCAARSDLAHADQWMKELGGPKKAEPWSVLAQARLLQQTHRPDEALDLLAKLPGNLPGELPAQIETLQIEILLAAGRLDDAIRASRGKAAVVELNVGYQLIQKERFADAHKLLSDVCPVLKGQSAEGNCLQLLEYADSKK